jgi:Glycosyltransferase family 87
MRDLSIGFVLRAVVALVGIATLVWLLFLAGGNGDDAFSYWRPPHLGLSLYAGAGQPDALGQFRFSPAFAQLVSPLWPLSWNRFLVIWTAISCAIYLLVARRWWIVGLGFLPVPFELFHGNIDLWMAAAVVAGFRIPVAWAVILLTNATPGVGVLWFAFRREWRSLAVAFAATAGVVAVSIAVGGAGVWGDWIRALGQGQAGTPAGWLVLSIRIALAVGVVAAGARRGWRWTVPMAVVMALPSPSFPSLSILIACLPLGVLESLRQLRGEGRASSEDAAVVAPALP